MEMRWSIQHHIPSVYVGLACGERKRDILGCDY